MKKNNGLFLKRKLTKKEWEQMKESGIFDDDSFEQFSIFLQRATKKGSNSSMESCPKCNNCEAVNKT